MGSKSSSPACLSASPQSSASAPIVPPHTRSSSSTSQQGTLFLWTISAAPLYSKLSFNIAREVCGYFRCRSYLLNVGEREVMFFDEQTRRWKVMFCHDDRLKNMHQYALVFLDMSRVFACGGACQSNSLLASAYELTKNVSKALPNMATARFRHGIVYDYQGNSVYVFGGFDLRCCNSQIDFLRGAERFIYSKGTWETLPYMLDARYHFQPCLHHSKIVLCGGNNTGSSEVFDIPTVTFRRIPLVTELWAALTVSDGDDLITYSSGRKQRWRLGSTAVHQQLYRTSMSWSWCPAVRIAGKTYYCIEGTLTVVVD